MTMVPDENPYESPPTVEDDCSSEGSRDGCSPTLFLGVCLVDGSLKLLVAALVMIHGSDLAEFAGLYNTVGRFWFAFGCLFMVFETIGPWFGVIYMIWYKQGTFSLNQALGRVLRDAGAISLMVTAVLMGVLEFIAR